MLKIQQLKQKGLTLVEVLVALALSSVLLAALVQIVSSNGRNVNLSESFIQVQESARLASDILSQELKLAGYRGCLNSREPAQTFNHIDPAGAGYDAFLHTYNQHLDGIENFVAGAAYDRNRMPATNTYGGVTPLDGSDVFISRGVVPTNVFVSAAPGVGAFAVSVVGNTDDVAEFVDGQVLLLSDCVQTEIFVSNGTVLANPPLSPSSISLNLGGVGPQNGPSLNGGLIVNYTVGAEMHILNTSVYFIAPSQAIFDDRDNDGVTDVNSLYKFSQLQGGAQELVPFISDLQFQYGITVGAIGTADNIIDAYVDADDGQLTDVNQIQSVRVSMTVSSLSQTAADGQPVTRTYTRVIQIRNTKIGS